LKDIDWKLIKDYRPHPLNATYKVAANQTEGKLDLALVVRDILDDTNMTAVGEEGDRTRFAELTEAQWQSVQERCKNRRRYGRKDTACNDNDDDDGVGGELDEMDNEESNTNKRLKIERSENQENNKKLGLVDDNAAAAAAADDDDDDADGNNNDDDDDEIIEAERRGAWSHVAIDLDSKAPCLISSYHGASNFSTKFIFEEANGLIRDGVTPNPRPRFFTTSECAKIMGFPPDFKMGCLTNSKNSNITTTANNNSEDDRVVDECEESRGHFYRQMGNAVCPPVIEAIASQLLDAI
jgi:site-specific DNA-cytosine methylase